MSRILIAGCGYVGSRLAEILRDAGEQVIGLRRNVGDLPPGIERLTADLQDPTSLATLPTALDHVVYAAAADDGSDAAYRAAYGIGIANLLTALASQRITPRRVYFTSSTGVFPQDDGSWVDETTFVDVPGRVDRVREGERIVASSSFANTIVRFGGIYGPGRTRLIDSVRGGTIRYRLEPPQWTNRIHREDCARVLAHLIAMERPEGLYVAVDDQPVAQHAVVEWLAKRLGVRIPPASTLETVGQGKRCRNTRLVTTGFRFRFPSYREGYADVLSSES